MVDTDVFVEREFVRIDQIIHRTNLIRTPPTGPRQISRRTL